MKIVFNFGIEKSYTVKKATYQTDHIYTMLKYKNRVVQLRTAQYVWHIFGINTLFRKTVP